MFDIDSSEFLLIGVVALVAIGPRDLPRLMRTAGRWVGAARRLSAHVQAGMDEMIRHAEAAASVAPDHPTTTPPLQPPRLVLTPSDHATHVEPIGTGDPVP